MRPIVIIIAKKKNKKKRTRCSACAGIERLFIYGQDRRRDRIGAVPRLRTCAENRIKEAAAAVLARAVHLVYDRRERSLVYAVVLPGSRAALRSDVRVLTIAFHAHIVIPNSRTSLISLLMLLSLLLLLLLLSSCYTVYEYRYEDVFAELAFRSRATRTDNNIVPPYTLCNRRPFYSRVRIMNGCYGGAVEKCHQLHMASV